MKRIYHLILFSVIILSPFATSKAQAQSAAKRINLFIIGNSFSQDATFYLPQIVREKGFELVLGRAEIGGGSLEQHWSAVAAYELDSLAPAGRLYNGKSLKMLLSAGNWDVVTMQQYSYLSANPNTYRPFAQKLCNYIKKLQPQAEIVMHQTWAYRNDAPVFGLVDKDKHAAGQQEMWEKSRATYRTIAEELSVRIIPSGDAFYLVDCDPKLGYKKDPLFDFSLPVYQLMPSQTNSMHKGYFWDNNKKLMIDANHASPAGRYLGSLVWYETLFNESAKKVKFKPEDVPLSFAATLRRKAAKALRMSKK